MNIFHAAYTCVTWLKRKALSTYYSLLTVGGGSIQPITSNEVELKQLIITTQTVPSCWNETE